MSGVVKGIGKVFKKVIKTVVKIAPVALAIGAALFTGGAALGTIPALAGGWGAAAGSMGTALGGSGILGGVLSGAITQAGYGALAGGAISLISGGDVSQGLEQGALIGGATGGLMGGVRAATGAANLAGKAAAPSTGAGQNVSTQAAKGAAAPPSADIFGNSIDPSGHVFAGAGNAGTQVSIPPPFSASAPVPGANPMPGASPAGSQAAGPGVFAKGGWLERNQDFAGDVIGGIGKVAGGIGSGLNDKATQDAYMDRLRERFDQTRANYSGAAPGRGLLYAAPGSGSRIPLDPGMTDPARIDPALYGEFEYQYNPQSGRIERMGVQVRP